MTERVLIPTKGGPKLQILRTKAFVWHQFRDKTQHQRGRHTENHTAQKTHRPANKEERESEHVPIFAGSDAQREKSAKEANDDRRHERANLEFIHSFQNLIEWKV